MIATDEPAAPPTTEQLQASLSAAIQQFIEAIGQTIAAAGGQVNPFQMLWQQQVETARLNCIVDLLIAKGVFTDADLVTRLTTSLHTGAAQMRKVQIATDVGVVMRQNGGKKR